MDGGALPILLILGIALAICFLAKPSSLFVVRIRDGIPQVGRGKVTDAFLDAIKEVCQDTGIQSGEVRGLPRGGRITLWGFHGNCRMAFASGCGIGGRFRGGRRSGNRVGRDEISAGEGRAETESRVPM